MLVLVNIDNPVQSHAWLNSDKIEYFYPNYGGLTILLVDGTTINIKESEEEFLDLLNSRLTPKEVEEIQRRATS